jgi:hypothetical protein
MTLDTLKDLFGLLGALVMTVPFFRDFARRLRRDQVRVLRPVFAPFAKALDQAETQQTTEMERASRGDLTMMLAGLLLLMASFGISLYIGLHAAGKVP